MAIMGMGPMATAARPRQRPRRRFGSAAYWVLWVQLMQHPLVHHLVQSAVQELVQLVHELQGGGSTTVELVQLCTQAEVQPASHIPAWAFLPVKTEMTMYELVTSMAVPV